MSHPEFNAGVTVDLSTTAESGVWIWVLRSLTAVALGLTAYLAWAALTASPVVGCGGSDVFDCGHVLNSKWSKIGGVPVSIPAFVLYCSLFSALVFCRHPGVPRIRRISWMWSTTCGVMAGLAAVWFTGLQIFTLESLCSWCLGAHACGLAICGLLVWKHPLGAKTTSQPVAVGILGLIVLITGQVLSPAPQTFEVLNYELDANDRTTGGVTTPGNVTSGNDAEDEFFAAPGEDIFEAPADATAVESITDAVQDDNSSDGGTSAPAAASLLLLLPPQISLMMNLPPISTESDDDSSTEDADESGEAEPTAAEEPKPERRLVGVNGNKFRLDVRQWPLLGQPEAKYIFVEMFDYTCLHCRNTHRAVRGAFDRYGDDLAIIALPVPLDRRCNPHVSGSGGAHRDSCEISRIAVAVWRIDANKFHQLHDWLFETKRTASATKRQAEQLVGKDSLSKELNYPTAGQYLAKHVELYNRVGAGSVPKLMFPKSSMVGEVSSTQMLCNTIERELAGR